jgi:hypothetical protein
MQPRVACRRTRAPQRLEAVAGLAPPLRRVERRHCRVPAGRITLASFPVARAVSWCCLRARPSPPTQFRVSRRRSPPHSAAGRRPPPRAAHMRPAPPDRDPADQI